MKIQTANLNEVISSVVIFVLICVRRARVIDRFVSRVFWAWGLWNSGSKKQKEMLMEIKETLEVIDLGMAIGTGVVNSLGDDGKFTKEDIVKFLPSVMALPAAVENCDEVPAELKDLDSAEALQIRDHILAKMPDVGEKWMVIATESFTIALSVYKIVAVLKKTKS